MAETKMLFSCSVRGRTFYRVYHAFHLKPASTCRTFLFSSTGRSGSDHQLHAPARHHRGYAQPHAAAGKRRNWGCNRHQEGRPSKRRQEQCCRDIDRKRDVTGKSVSVRRDPGGCRSIKKKKKKVTSK